MKNIIIYYTASFLPGLVLAFMWQDLKPGMALPLLLGYVFLYRNVLDAWRLLSRGAISKKDAWKVAIPGMRGKYLKQLYFEK